MRKRLKLYRQHDGMECGVACLWMICNHYKQNVSIKRLSELCGVTTSGVSLLGISNAATALGLHTIAGRVTIRQLSEALLPCLLHWNQNHFVVLYKIKNHHYYIADPAKGYATYKDDDMKKYWISTVNKGEEMGVALFFQPTPQFYEQKSDDVRDNRSICFLMGYVWLYKRYFAQIILGLIVGCFMQLLMPLLTQSVIDVGIKNQDIGFVWLILAGQLMLTVSRAMVDFVRRWLLLHISMRINISLISDFLIKLMKLPMSFFDTKLIGDLMQRMNDHERVEKFLTGNTLTIMFSSMSFVVFGTVLFFYHHIIFTVFLIGSIAYAGWIMLFLHQRKLIDYELFQKYAENSSKTFQLVTSMQAIKLHDCEQRRRWEWEDIQSDLFQVQMKSLKLGQTQEAGSILINETKNIVITVLSAAAVIHGEITLGMMLAVQYIIGQLNGPVEQLMKFFYSLQDLQISLERINEIHSADCEEDCHRKVMEHRCKNKGIVFNEVFFKYDRHSFTYTLDNICLNIPEGKTTAIVGASGSGKTTLVKLMLGYYPVNSGIIQVSGCDINELSLKWWRRQCGVVMQDGVIFSESIARNIAVDDGEIDVKRLEKAAEIACIKDFIMKLPLRFNTIIGQDGMGLSQGQKQRILIARAVYSNPNYMFLDEATNALDANNERAIVENLSCFYKGRTVVVVAHRLSTVRYADQIIVVEKGSIVETGDHSTLIKKRGVYYNLVKNQLELGI